MRQPLHEALRNDNEPAGALTVILGDMGSGKVAVGLAFARTALQHGGFLTLCQPWVGGHPVRPLAALESRLARSLENLKAGDAWRARTGRLLPSNPLGSRGGAASGTFGAALAGGELFPPEASEVNWQSRMLVVQDYGVLCKEEADLSPWRMRALAGEQAMNLVLLADTTGADRTIALVDRQDAPEGSGSATINVRSEQIELAQAAHRLFVVERRGNGVQVHTLKSPKGPGGSHGFELDAGFLAWPPVPMAHLDERAAEKARGAGEDQQDESLQMEAPRA